MESLARRIARLEMTDDEFRKLGHLTVDLIAGFLGSLRDRPVVPDESPMEVRKLLGGGLPKDGMEPDRLLKETASLLFDHSLFNGHPRFWGYITSSAAPIGALADLLAAAVNPNVGGWNLSPMASEIEKQTIEWIAEMIGFPINSGGILVTGGNMANFVCFLAARRRKLTWDVRTKGLAGPTSKQLRIYASSETHTWIQKAADLFGLGTDSINWIPVDDQLRLKTDVLSRKIREDGKSGLLPFLVVGGAGTVSTGAVDPLPEMAEICREHGLWFHVDAAYGGFAAALPDASKSLRGLSLADSVAVDPHKWLYAPLDVGCALVRDKSALRDTFSYHPPYYKFDENEDETTNYYELGPQNSRGFRALKVWLALRQAGREGYVKMITDDINLARELYRLVKVHGDLEAFTQNLSITTFRYTPADLKPGPPNVEEYLNKLNIDILTRLRKSGEAYLSNAVIGGKFVLRACIVNFRTSQRDIEALPGMVVRIGREVDSSIRPKELRVEEPSEPSVQ